MHKTTITSQGTISIPSSLRKKYNLKPGEKLIIEDTGKLTLSKIPSFSELRKENNKKVSLTQEYNSGDGFIAYVKEKYGKR